MTPIQAYRKAIEAEMPHCIECGRLIDEDKEITDHNNDDWCFDCWNDREVRDEGDEE